MNRECLQHSHNASSPWTFQKYSVKIFIGYHWLGVSGNPVIMHWGYSLTCPNVICESSLTIMQDSVLDSGRILENKRSIAYSREFTPFLQFGFVCGVALSLSEGAQLLGLVSFCLPAESLSSDDGVLVLSDVDSQSIKSILKSGSWCCFPSDVTQVAAMTTER